VTGRERKGGGRVDANKTEGRADVVAGGEGGHAKGRRVSSRLVEGEVESARKALANAVRSADQFVPEREKKGGIEFSAGKDRASPWKMRSRVVGLCVCACG
jgi:hypothetical protein